MYPPKAADADVIRLIRELTVNGRPPSGAELRRALAERHGTKGGVTRVYRLLQQQNARRSPGTPWSAHQPLLEQKVSNLQQLLDSAIKTADAHQTFWKSKVDEMRQQINVLEQAIREAVCVGIAEEALLEKIQSLAVEGGRLEILLRAFGPATAKEKLMQLIRQSAP